MGIKAGKVCKKCGCFKSLKYFSKNRRSNDGFRTTCKDCDKEQQRNSRLNIKYIVVERKQCSECGRILPISDFGIDKTKKDMHRSYCLECMREQAKHRKRLRLIQQPTSRL